MDPTMGRSLSPLAYKKRHMPYKEDLLTRRTLSPTRSLSPLAMHKISNSNSLKLTIKKINFQKKIMCLDLSDILSLRSILCYYKFELKILYRGGVRLKEHV
jgi:hypothetical protein